MTRTSLDARGRSPHVRSSRRSIVRRRSRGSLPRLHLERRADWRKSMRLRPTALAAILVAAIVPSLTVPAEAWDGHVFQYCGYGYGDSGFGYEVYGCTPIYNYGWRYPAYREHRYASHRYVRRRTAVRGDRRARSFNSAGAASTSGAAATGSPSPSPSSASSPSASSPLTSTAQPGPAANQPSTQVSSTTTEPQQAKVGAINANASESEIQRKLADTEANLKQAKDEAAQATKEAQQTRADAQSERQSTEADLKQAKDQAAQATRSARGCEGSARGCEGSLVAFKLQRQNLLNLFQRHTLLSQFLFSLLVFAQVLQAHATQHIRRLSELNIIVTNDLHSVAPRVPKIKERTIK